MPPQISSTLIPLTSVTAITAEQAEKIILSRDNNTSINLYLVSLLEVSLPEHKYPYVVIFTPGSPEPWEASIEGNNRYKGKTLEEAIHGARFSNQA